MTHSKNLVALAIALSGLLAAPAFAQTAAAPVANTAAPVAPAGLYQACLLYTSPSPRDRQKSRMPSSA